MVGRGWVGSHHGRVGVARRAALRHQPLAAVGRSARRAGSCLPVAASRSGLQGVGMGAAFAADERPRPFALAAGNGGAALIGVVFPGRFDDAMRVAVVRRYPGCRAGVRALCLSLVMLGLIDSVALAPLAAAAAVLGGGIGVRAGLTLVAVAGVAAAGLLVALPRLAGSNRALRFRLGRWLSPRTTSRRRLSEAWVLVSACWLLRALAAFLLLGTLGVGFSFPLALLLLCASAAAAAVPIGPAGAAAQVGAGAAALIASGVGGSEALAVTLAGGALGVLTGAAIFLAAVVWRAGLLLATTRTRRMPDPWAAANRPDCDREGRAGVRFAALVAGCPRRLRGAAARSEPARPRDLGGPVSRVARRDVRSRCASRCGCRSCSFCRPPRFWSARSSCSATARTGRSCARGAQMTFLGAGLGLLVWLPYRGWQHEHAVHHATAGDLDRRGVGDIADADRHRVPGASRVAADLRTGSSATRSSCSASAGSWCSF